MSDPKQSLLIVDDEPSIRTSMSYLLAEIGYSVRSAEDGSSALEAIRQAIPDILLSDLNMAGMSGFELLSVVRHSYPGIHTIAMSGAFCGNEVPTGVAADAFYQKGSSLGALLQILRTLPRTQRPVTQFCRAVAPLRTYCNGNDWSAKTSVATPCPVCPAPSGYAAPQALRQNAHAPNLAQNASAPGN
jgi:CheY-like chemotaxis protein